MTGTSAAPGLLPVPRKAGWSTSAGRPVVTCLLVVAALAALAEAGHFLISGLSAPLLDIYAFRQTQTALTAYWLLHGGPWLKYETPNLGYPWSIPFEFPLYQWVVAILAATGLSLEASGRLVSFGFHVACLWPIARMSRWAGFGHKGLLVFATLFLSAPLYIYWARGFMIESCALFFSLLAVSYVLDIFLARSVVPVTVTAAVAGSLGALVKLTTFVPALCLSALVLVAFLVRVRRQWAQRDNLIRIASACVAILIPVATCSAWTRFSDAVKAENPLAAGHLTSDVLLPFTVGTLPQRFSAELWARVISGQILPDFLGYSTILAGVAVGAVLLRRNSTFLGLAAIGGFLSAPLAFSNLYIVHSYYPYANGVYLLCAVAIGITTLLQAGRPVVALVLLALIAGGQQWYFYRVYPPIGFRDANGDRYYEIALVSRDIVPASEALIVLGDDWSPVSLYISRHKGLVLPNWNNLSAKVFQDPQPFLGGSKLGGIIYCPAYLDTYGKDNQALVRFLADRKTLAQTSDCKLVGDKSSAG